MGMKVANTAMWKGISAVQSYASARHMPMKMLCVWTLSCIVAAVHEGEQVCDATETALQMLSSLRTEAFNHRTEQRLATHPYVLAAEDGSLTQRQLQAFVQEQYYVQRSDAVSFANLAGAAGFMPPFLSNATMPSNASDDLFGFLLGGELYAAKLLLDQAAWLGVGGDAELMRYEPSALALAYPSYWSYLSLTQNRAAAAAACAVNFPAWGRMCKRVHDAVAKGSFGAVSEKDLGFLNFFGTPVEGLDKMAAKAMVANPVSYAEIKTHVRILQSYEVLFWDSVFGNKE